MAGNRRAGTLGRPGSVLIPPQTSHRHGPPPELKGPAPTTPNLPGHLPRAASHGIGKQRMPTVIANGKTVEAQLPCSLEEFLRAQGLPPRSVVVELNGEAIPPSQFPHRQVRPGDRLEIVRIVAGG